MGRANERTDLRDKGADVTGTPLYDSKHGIDIGLPFNLQHSIDRIKEEDADSVEVLIKPNPLGVFGSNLLVGSTSFATVMNLPAAILNETYVADNDILNISSSDSNDDQIIVVTGYYIDDDEFVYHSQEVTLDGQNKVELSQALLRVELAYNNDDTDLNGIIYIYEADNITGGVPDTNALVHLIIPTGENQSYKCAVSTSNEEYIILTGISASVNEKTTAIVDIELQIKKQDKTWRTVHNFAVSTAGMNSIHIPFDPTFIIPPNSDARVRAKASATAVSVSVRLEGHRAVVQT